MNQRIDGAASCCHSGQFSDFKVEHAKAQVDDPGAIDGVTKPVQAAATTTPSTSTAASTATATDSAATDSSATDSDSSLMGKLTELLDEIMHVSSLAEMLDVFKKMLSLLSSSGAGTDGTDPAASTDSASTDGSNTVGPSAVPVPVAVNQPAAAGTAGQASDTDFNAIGSKKSVQAPATAAPATDPAAATTAAPTQQASATNGATATQGDININGGGKNTISVKNTSDREQNYAVFTNPTAGMSSSFGKPDGFVTLKPGESVNLKLPEQSSGYLQQMNNYTKADYDANKAPEANNFKASRAEYTFNKDGSLYFNSSIIDGYNASLKMSANGQTAGSNESVLDKIAKTNPGLIETVGDQKVVRGTQFFTDQTDTESRDALDKYVNHNDNPGDLNGNTTAYVVPNDDKAVRGTQGNALQVEFGNA